MDDLSAVLVELATLRERLEATDDPEIRGRLEALRADLRSRALRIRAEADPEGSATDLRAELNRLRGALRRLSKRRVRITGGVGGVPRGGEGFAGYARSVNREIDAEGDRERIEARITEIEQRLADLEAGGRGGD